MLSDVSSMVPNRTAKSSNLGKPGPREPSKTGNSIWWGYRIYMRVSNMGRFHGTSRVSGVPNVDEIVVYEARAPGRPCPSASSAYSQPDSHSPRIPCVGLPVDILWQWLAFKVLEMSVDLKKRVVGNMWPQCNPFKNMKCLLNLWLTSLLSSRYHVLAYPEGDVKLRTRLMNVYTGPQLHLGCFLMILQGLRGIASPYMPRVNPIYVSLLEQFRNIHTYICPTHKLHISRSTVGTGMTPV